MPNKHSLMKLPRDEELFLRHWLHDEVQFLNGVGPAKRLQVEHRVAPAELALMIAAAIPDPHAQEEAATEPPADTPRWPWSNGDFQTRVTEARTVLEQRAAARSPSVRG